MKKTLVWIVCLLLAALLLVPAVPVKAAGEDPIIGVYEGTYTAAQGITGVTLCVYETENGLESAFRFYPVASNPSVGKGIACEDVQRNADGTYTFTGKDWVDHEDAPSYVLVDLKDVTLSGDRSELHGTVLNHNSGGVSGEIDAVRISDVPVPQEYLGTWSGRYEAAQGITGLTLDIYRSGEQTLASFHFYPVEENPGVEEGTYLMAVTCSAQDGRCRLDGIKWLTKSPTYRFVDLEGSIGADGTFSGDVTAMMYSASQRYAFSLAKSGDAGKNVNVYYEGGSVPVRLDDTLFEQNAAVYHKDLATLAAALSGAFGGGRQEDGEMLHDAYETLGFTLENTEVFVNQEEGSPFSFATRTIGENCLLTIVMGGIDCDAQQENAAQIISDLRADEDSPSFYGYITGAGFYGDCERVYTALEEYLQLHPQIAAAAKDGRLRVLITGQDAGAADAQLFGVACNKGVAALPGLNSENIFVYTFASPNTYYDPDRQGGDAVYTDNIFNIVNTEDPVTQVPAVKIMADDGNVTDALPYRQFGHTLSYSDEENVHEAASYVNAVTQYQTQWNDGTHAYEDTRDLVSYVIAGPGNVQVLGPDGTVLAASSGQELTVQDQDVIFTINPNEKIITIHGDTPYQIVIESQDSGKMYAAQFEGKNDPDLFGPSSAYENVKMEQGKRFVLQPAEDAVEAMLYVTDAYGKLLAQVTPDGREVPIEEQEDVIQIPDASKETGRVSVSMYMILIIAAAVALVIGGLVTALVIILVTRNRKKKEKD